MKVTIEQRELRMRLAEIEAGECFVYRNTAYIATDESDYTPSGNRYVVSLEDGTLMLMDVRTEVEVIDIEVREIPRKAYGEDGMPTSGELIRKARKKKGISQAELGERLGVTQAAITQFERDKTNIKMATVTKIAEALNVAPASLMPLHDKIKIGMMNRRSEEDIKKDTHNEAELRRDV